MGSHSLPYLPRMSSNTVLASGPAVEAAQILIWSYSCVFVPPMSTAIKTSVFSFVEDLIIPPVSTAIKTSVFSFEEDLVMLPMSTAIKTSAFSFVEDLIVLLYIPQTQNLPS